MTEEELFTTMRTWGKPHTLARLIKDPVRKPAFVLANQTCNDFFKQGQFDPFPK